MIWLLWIFIVYLITGIITLFILLSFLFNIKIPNKKISFDDRLDAYCNALGVLLFFAIIWPLFIIKNMSDIMKYFKKLQNVKRRKHSSKKL